MKQNRIDIITMGCSKNLVDSEDLGRLFGSKGYNAVLDADVGAVGHRAFVLIRVFADINQAVRLVLKPCRAGKGGAANVGDHPGDIDLFQAAAILEGRIADIGDRDGNGHIHQSRAVSKGV